MTTLAEWQSFARSTGLKGWSRLKKNELVDFLMQNLWFGGGLDNPKMNKAARLRIRKYQKNPLEKKIPAIKVPILIPRKRSVFPKAIPRAIRENVNNVVDWAGWLESVKDAEIRKRSTPAVEKLKKQIAELWGEKLTVEKGKSAFGKFAKQFIIRGDDSTTPQEFFRKARGEIVLLLRQNPQTKVQCILNVEMIQNRISGEDELSDPFFPSRQKENLGNNFDIVEEMIQEIIEAMENYNKRGSNWVFKRVIHLDVNFVRWNPLRGSAWIPLPVKLANKKAVINMINRDNMCFKWCIARAANMCESHPERITEKLREQAEKFDWTDCKFPMAVDKIKFFEKRNNVSINVYEWKGYAGPLRIAKEEKPFHVDLVFLTKDFQSHFALIKNFSRFAPGKGQTERFFCKRCLNSFPKPESLKKHKEICGEFAAAKIELPGGKCSFKNWERMMHVPVVVYADFESILRSLRDREKNKTHEHIPCGFCFHLVSPFLQMEPVLKRAENETNQLPQDFIRELISQVKQAHLSLPKKEMIPLSSEEWKKFRESETCWLCKGKFGEKGFSKVRDHCHFTGKFRGAAHQSCNLKFQRPKFTPVFFHNLQNYDAHLFVRALGLMDEVLSIKCIPNNDEQYISFSLKFELKRITKWDFKTEEWKEVVIQHEIRFLDSFKFTLAGLEGLVKNLSREDLKETTRFFGEKIDLVSRKGVYPYEFMDDFEKFKKQSLPKKTSFFSRLKQEKISDEDFEHAQRVWKEFELKNMGDFHDLYLKTDVLLLADVMENFRKLCEKHYGLDPAHFFTVPGMAWDAMLKMTGIELELLEDGQIDMLLMIEKGIRGGISNAFKRYAKANNKFMQKYDPNLKSSFIVYLDANNLYGWAMSKPLPVGKFEWMTEEELENWERFVEEEGVGCILEVDLEYPAELHDFHNDFPLAPEKLTLGKVEKLTQNLRDKEAMVLHGKNLQLYLSLGMKLKLIRRGLKFKEKDFMKCYIDKNTSLRSQAKNDFEKELFKLMNNSVFGKTMENVRKRVSIELVKDAERAAKLVNKPNFEDLKIFDEFLIAIKMRKTKVWMNKPVYVGMSILDLSKTLMFDFHYGYVKKKWENCEVLYSDTDSLVLKIETDDFFADISGDVAEWFDTNDYAKDHPAVLGGLPIVKENKKKIGLMKDDCGGKIVTEWVALRPKLYSFLTEVGGKQKAKGLKKSMKNKSLRHENFLKCLRTGESQTRKQCLFRSRDHHIFTENMVKVALSANDDKRIVLENGIDTLSLGHVALLEE